MDRKNEKIENEIVVAITAAIASYLGHTNFNIENIQQDNGVAKH